LSTKSPSETGKVYLVGAGLEAGQITLRGLRLLRRADVIVYDALADPQLLQEARPDAQCINVGKRARKHNRTQQQTNDLLVQLAREGNLVIRLKGGDPFLFGRGAEELTHLAQKGIPCAMVPGVTAGIAAPATAGMSVTHRDHASMVTFVTGHEDPTSEQTSVDYSAVTHMVQAGGTVCFYMGSVHLSAICAKLIELGADPSTHAAVVESGCTPRQKTVVATLQTLEAQSRRAQISAPTVIVVGAIAALKKPGLDFFVSRPLFGRTVVITRTRRQASSLRHKLSELGAQVLEAPTIELLEPASWTEIDQAIANIGEYDWLVLTSVNGVATLEKRMEAIGADARLLSGAKIAAIGKATANELRQRLGIVADLVPASFVAEALAEELIQLNQTSGKRFLLLRADIARPALPQLLSQAGAVVSELTAYRTVAADHIDESATAALQQNTVDWITFTSSSTAQNMVKLLADKRDLLTGVKLASIGPITSDTLRQLGLEPTVQADPHDIDGLIQAIIEHESRMAK